MKRNHDISTGRPTPILTFSLTSQNTMTNLVMTLLLLYLTPAFCSCSEEESYTDPSGATCLRETIPTTIYIKSIPGGGTLDFFTFNDDRLRRLDSYQRIESFSGGKVNVSSRTGSKIMVAIANLRAGEEEIDRILSYDDLLLLHSELSDEDTSRPVMSGEAVVEAGKGSFSLKLEPLLAEIRLNSIRCNFKGRPYEDSRLEDVKVYLTNICSRYPVAGPAPEYPESIINQGGYSEQDMASTGNPGAVSGEIPEGIGSGILYPDINLYCYPNSAVEEGPGTPFTRMVIEGTLDGARTYYPININREEGDSGASGVHRNMSYKYDITITRRGVDDPDTPVAVDMIGIPMFIEEWNGKSHRTITY